eukprot:5304733-Alexandrium_andersonii.AAC.1
MGTGTSPRRASAMSPRTSPRGSSAASPWTSTRAAVRVLSRTAGLLDSRTSEPRQSQRTPLGLELISGPVQYSSPAVSGP